MKQAVDWLVVGAGYSGAVVAERLATELGQTVLVIDKRDHIGGNAYDYIDDHGVLVHRYGPHIFHTNSRRVWAYLSRFTSWRPYFHRVLASVDGQMVPVPFNLNTVYSLFPPKMAARVESELISKYGFGSRVPILRMREESSGLLKIVAEFVYEKLIAGYTKKQWDLEPTQLSSSVTARVPLVISRDDRYFHDCYQALPVDGYTEMFRRILGQSGIELQLGVGFPEVRDSVDYKHLIYTGPIDEFFDYKFGALPYRSLRFELDTVEGESLQLPAGQMNYPNEFDFTRQTEFRHLTGQLVKATTIATEYPEPFVSSSNERFYPVPQSDNRLLYAEYSRCAAGLSGEVFFLGRLADYRYYNMDQAVHRALSRFEEIALFIKTGQLGQSMDDDD